MISAKKIVIITKKIVILGREVVEIRFDI